MPGCSSANVNPRAYLFFNIFWPLAPSKPNVSVVKISVGVSTVPDKGRTRPTFPSAISINAQGFLSISSVKRATINFSEGVCSKHFVPDHVAIPGGQFPLTVVGFPIFLRILGKFFSEPLYGDSLTNRCTTG